MSRPFIASEGAALREWQSAGRMYWTRVPSGWTDEAETICVNVNVDSFGDQFIAVCPQRQLQRGKDRGLWKDSNRGDIHTREDYEALMTALAEAGRLAGWTD